MANQSMTRKWWVVEVTTDAHLHDEVMHSTKNDGDHIWNLNDQDKEHIRKTKAKGTAG